MLLINAETVQVDSRTAATLSEEIPLHLLGWEIGSDALLELWKQIGRFRREVFW